MFCGCLSMVKNGLIFPPTLPLVHHGHRVALLMVCEIVYVQQNSEAWPEAPGQPPECQGTLLFLRSSRPMPINAIKVAQTVCVVAIT